METEVIHTTRKGKSILLYYPLILNYRCISHTNSYNNAITQCHVDRNQRAWATCEISGNIIINNRYRIVTQRPLLLRCCATGVDPGFFF